MAPVFVLVEQVGHVAEDRRHVGVPAQSLAGRKPVRAVGRPGEEVGEFGVAEDVLEQADAVLHHRVERGRAHAPRVAPRLLDAEPHPARDQKQRQHDAYGTDELAEVAEDVEVHWGRVNAVNARCFARSC